MILQETEEHPAAVCETNPYTDEFEIVYFEGGRYCPRETGYRGQNFFETQDIYANQLPQSDPFPVLRECSKENLILHIALSEMRNLKLRAILYHAVA